MIMHKTKLADEREKISFFIFRFMIIICCALKITNEKPQYVCGWGFRLNLLYRVDYFSEIISAIFSLQSL